MNRFLDFIDDIIWLGAMATIAFCAITSMLI